MRSAAVAPGATASTARPRPPHRSPGPPVSDRTFVALADLDDEALVTRYDPGAPDWLRINFVSSLDGAVTVKGYSEGLSGEADKRVFGVLRMRCDALLVGAGTLRHEGYGGVRLGERRRTWRRGHGLAEHPTLVIVSRQLALDAAHPALVDAPTRPIVLTHLGAPADRRAMLEGVADVLAYGDEGEVDLAAGLAALRERGLRQILSEGGPHVLGALAEANLVDELDLTLSPLLVGSGAGRITAGAQPVDNVRQTMRLRHVLHADDVLILRYDRTR